MEQASAAVPERTAAPSPMFAGNAAVRRSLDGAGPAPPLVTASMVAAGNAAVTRLARRAPVQRAELDPQGSGPLDERTGAAIDAERGRGAPLPEQVRRDMEPRLGADLGAVRVHTGTAADTLNRAVSAEAFTTGADVFFGAGRYDPTSTAGQELLAHELVHVVQQIGNSGGAGRVSHPDEGTEVEARAVARRVAHDTSPAGTGPGSPTAASGPGSPAAASASRTVARQVGTVARNGGKRNEEKRSEDAAVLAVAQRALKRAAEINALQGSVVKALKASSPRLRDASETYEKAHTDFTGTLDKADEAFAREQKATDIVQDILVGTFVGLLGPAGIAARVAIPAAAAAGRVIATTARTKVVATASDVLAGLIDEGIEPVANWAVDAATSESSAPGKTAGLAGPSPGARYKAVVAELDSLIAYLPDLTPLVSTHQRLAALAIEASRSDDAALDDLVTWLDGETAALAAAVSGLTLPFASLVQAVLSAPVRAQTEAERMLWTEWVARLRPPYDELNYRVVRERLATVGLSFLFDNTTGAMTGDYSGDRITSDSAHQVTANARAAWLQTRGVPAEPGNEAAVQVLFESATTLETFEKAGLVGKQGTFKWDDSVVVDGAVYPLAIGRSAGSVPRHIDPGDPVVVESVWPPWGFLNAMAEKYMADGAAWTKHGVLTASDVGVTVRWEHGSGDRYQPYGPPVR